MESNKIKITACIITYNHEKFLRQCLEGAINQELDEKYEYEILIGEDHSTDSTLEICREYKEKYPQLMTLLERSKNLGLMGNWMDTLEACEGDFIALCEGDDYWTDPKKLQKQIDFLEANEKYVACFTDARIKNEITGDEGGYVKENKNRNFDLDEIIRRGGGFFPTPTLVFRNIIGKWPDFVCKYRSGDRALSLLLADKGNFYYLKENTAVYRRHLGGVYSSIRYDKSVRNQIRLDNIYLLKEFNEYFGFKYDKEIRKAISTMAKVILLNGGNSNADGKAKGVYKELIIKDWFSLLYHILIKKK